MSCSLLPRVVGIWIVWAIEKKIQRNDYSGLQRYLDLSKFFSILDLR